ncbi:MAG: ABC transporter ATP-binding protein [Myxococcota bacterium]
MSASHLVIGAQNGAAVALRNVTKVYGHGTDAVLALDDVGFSVRSGEFLCLVGASGCGKSTILHMIAGLDSPTAGTMAVPEGGVAMMFQDAALFPWLTVSDNIGFPLRMSGMDAAARKVRVNELLAMVHLEQFADRQPHELSGGMRQRVALARAIAQNARVLLMDEPFAALDAMMRDHLHDELERVWRETGLTVLFVTHNPREAARLGDRILLLSSRPGRVADEIRVSLPRPRRIDSTEIATIAAQITNRLTEIRHGSPGTEAEVRDA